MQSATLKIRQLQLIIKFVAIICGCALLIASSQSDITSLDYPEILKFLASQLQSTSQLQWTLGIISLSAGIFLAPVKTGKRRSYVGDKDLSNASYVLYLVDQYQIKKNLVLDQYITCNRIFPCIEDALAYVHLLGHELEKAPTVSSKLASTKESKDALEENLPESSKLVENEQFGLKNPFLSTKKLPDQGLIESLVKTRRIKIILVGATLFLAALGGVYFANSYLVGIRPKPVAAIPPITPIPEVANSDQLASGSIPAQEPVIAGAGEAKDTSKTLVSIPINERWIGSWLAEVEGVKLKLVVTSSLLTFNNEEFTWTGARPKGVVQCCLAFYEGATNKSDLLARISGAQEPGSVLKPEAQKTLNLVNGLSDGNFKRLVFADPYLKKYFFIYDQNYVYRISRDLGDKADVVIEQFKKQE